MTDELNTLHARPNKESTSLMAPFAESIAYVARKTGEENEHASCKFLGLVAWVRPHPDYLIVASFDGIKEGEKTGGVVKLCHSSCIHRWLR